jgi:hypothetical protein
MVDVPRKADDAAAHLIESSSPKHQEAFVDEVPVSPEPEVDNYGGVFYEAKVALGALSKVVTSPGRQELATKKELRREREEEIVRFIGEKILHPDRSPDDPRKMKPWGVHKLLIDDDPNKPNPYRPITKAEKRHVKKMEYIHSKMLAISNERRWLENSYGPKLQKNKYDLSASERISMSRTSRKMEKQEKSIAKLENKFKTFQYSRDLRSRLSRILPF